jgi:ArsR family transcriptional regulator, arsenate/arsenite/antimonite-responsive transcriptional repressor
VSATLQIEPRRRRPAGEVCCEPRVRPEVSEQRAEHLARLAKALGDPTRLQLVDVLRLHAGQVCVCELSPLFDMSQQALSQHLKKLMNAGIVGREKRGIWAFYYVNAEALEDLWSWLS